VVAPGVDRIRDTYGRHWDLRRSEDRGVLACLIVDVLQPVVIHLGIVCTPLCVIGKGVMDKEGAEMVFFCLDVADHQVAHHVHASFENPVGSELHRLPRVQASVGTLERPLYPWRHVRSDGCQMGLVFQGVNEPSSYGMPMQKGQIWTSTFCLSRLALRCRKGDALLETSHAHRVIRGSHKVSSEKGDHGESVAAVSGHYTPMCGELYGQCAAEVVANTVRATEAVPTALRRLAEEARASRTSVLATVPETACPGTSAD